MITDAEGLAWLEALHVDALKLYDENPAPRKDNDYRVILKACETLNSYVSRKMRDPY